MAGDEERRRQGALKLADELRRFLDVFESFANSETGWSTQLTAEGSS
jgi:hypothetical protein